MLHLGKLTVYNNRKARSFFVKGVGGCEKNEAEGRNIGWDMEGIPDTGCCHVAADILCIMRPDGVAPVNDEDSSDISIAHIIEEEPEENSSEVTGIASRWSQVLFCM